MRFGAHEVRDALVLSPMVDVTDAAFRSLALEWGADVTCSEMTSAAGIVHDNPTSWRLVQPWPGEAPYGVQLMGGDPRQMADAVDRVCGRIQPDFIDLNLGCPSPRILRTSAGGFLLRDPKKAGQVIGAAADAGEEHGVPVSVKMRTGPTADRLTYLDVGAEAQAAGATFCTLHGRTVDQGYTGLADWSCIARLVEHLDIPVIGNGDLRDGADVVRMRDETACAGFFIARAAMNDVTIFRRLRAALDGKDAPEAPGMPQQLALLAEYVRRAGHIGMDDLGNLRRQGTRFVAGAPGAKRMRTAMHEAPDVAAFLALTEPPR